MGKIILYFFLGCAAIAALIRPWVGVVGAYLISILTPQNIWWWNFEGMRPFYYIALPTIIGFVFAAIKGDIDFSRLRTKINCYMAILWLCIIISYYFGPYVNASGTHIFPPSYIFATFNKIFIFYFIGVLLIDSSGKLNYLTLVIIISTVYMIYWANSQYLSGRWFGRLHGPAGLSGGGVYSDENTFAMLFVTGLPFIYYLGYYISRKWIRYLIWLIIPFGWHAIFLTGSRGGMLGLGTTVLVAAWRSPKRLIGLLLIPMLLIAYVWQGGNVLKQRMDNIVEYREDASATGRLDAWKAATRMIIAHPITGVGLACFVTAFPNFSDKRPREAHNSFFQLASECGIVAGCAYLLIMFSILKQLLSNSTKLLLSKNDLISKDLYLINEAMIVSLIGFMVCSLFLSLQIYEIFYYLALIGNAIYFRYCRSI